MQLKFIATEKLQRSYRERREKERQGIWKANTLRLVHEQRAKVGHVRMQMVSEGVGVIYKAGSSRRVRMRLSRAATTAASGWQQQQQAPLLMRK